MKRSSFLFLAAGTLLALGACTTTSVSGIGGGTGTGATGTGGGTGGGCEGDAAKWATITAGPFTCTQNSDCCVVMNGCLSQAQIVEAKDYAAAPGAWPYCPSACVGCIGPAVQIACVDGACVGESLDPTSSPPPDPSLFMSHCGVDAVNVGAPATAHKFGCGT